MPRVIVGYGQYQGYRPAELPNEVLYDLGHDYPLQLKVNATPDAHLLMITIALHSEIERRRRGAGPEKRSPTVRELALDIVDRGYRNASKQISLGSRGREEKISRLTEAREFLLQAITRSASDEENDGVIEIPAPPQSKWDRDYRETYPCEDDDVPF
ncbi:MAG: hypothetical protein JNL98_40665 [Bryobacterales bacterium]|nr:hypothetical protein [Bryobacterales bacterium]